MKVLIKNGQPIGLFNRYNEEMLSEFLINKHLRYFCSFTILTHETLHKP